MAIPQSTPPDPDEIEVSVFGPGFGESVVVHVGSGAWMVVDSCMAGVGVIPKPVDYLRSIGQKPEECVRVVVATHWHDDHVAGLSGVLEACRDAVFCCSSALSSKEFLQLAELYRASPSGFSPGLGEIRQSVELSANRSKEKKRQMLKYAGADRLLWTSNGVRLIALSPADEMQRRALEFMVQSYRAATSGKIDIERPISVIPNDTAAVLRIDFQHRSILLGSDLEAGQSPLVGWSAVLTSPMAGERKSSVFKVAHHGSASGWHGGVWSDLLEPRPFALMSPFRWGRHRLPTAVDRARLLAATERAFITSHPDQDFTPIRKRAPKVESLINQTAKTRRAAYGPVGHVRWRALRDDPNDDGRVDLFDGALSLADTAP